MYQLAYWLSLAAIFVIPWESSVTISALGSIGKVVGVLGGICWLAAVAIRRRVRRPHLFHWMFLLFILWNTLSLLWSAAPDRSLERVITYWQLFVFVYLLWDLFTTPIKLRSGLQAYIFGGYITIFSIVSGLLSGAAARYSATGFNSNVAGIILALGIGIAWYLAFGDEVGKTHHGFTLLNFAYIPLSLLCILLTGSRSALMAASPAFLFILASLQRFSPMIRSFLFALLIGIGLALLPFAQTSIERVSGASFTRKGYLNGREETWQKSINVFTEHPLLGVGSFAFQAAATETTEDTKIPHSFIFALLSEVGMIGFSLFMILVGISMVCALQQDPWNSKLWLAVLFGWILGASTQNLEHRKQTWLAFCLPVCSSAVSRNRSTSKNLVYRHKGESE
jgi:O-antigen ligase